VPDDPAVLQERAEVALLQGEYDRAATLAERAFTLGSQVGPLCRQHWETLRQVRQHGRTLAAVPKPRQTPDQAAEQAAGLAALDQAIDEAGRRRDACTVPVIERM